jgi:predicted nuclease of predicted toxin-antitoxin system
VKLKLDENVPIRLVPLLVSSGHDVATVADELLGGAKDRLVADAARVEGRLLLTLDRGFADIRTYPPGSHPGIVVLRPRVQTPAAVTRMLESLLAGHQLSEFGGCVSIVEPAAIRVRRPE